MIAYQRFGQGETPASSGLKGDHLAGKYYVLFEKHYREEVRQLEAEGVASDIAKKKAPLMAEAQAPAVCSTALLMVLLKALMRPMPESLIFVS